jgi:surface protein
MATSSAVVYYFEYICNTCTTTRVHRITLLTRTCTCIVLYVRVFCFCVFEMVPFVVGWSFYFFVPPSLAQCLSPHQCSTRTCPNGIRVRWQIWLPVSAVYMTSLSLWPVLATRFPLLCNLNVRQLELHRITLLTRFVFCCCCVFESVSFWLFLVGWSSSPFSLFCTLFFVVFNTASAFNSDVSKWNTGVVTNMQSSKCLSSSLWPRLPLFNFWMYNNNSSFIGSHFSHTFCFFCVCVFETAIFCCCLCGGLAFPFLCLTFSCSVL